MVLKTWEDVAIFGLKSSLQLTFFTKKKKVKNVRTSHVFNPPKFKPFSSSPLRLPSSLSAQLNSPLPSSLSAAIHPPSPLVTSPLPPHQCNPSRPTLNPSRLNHHRRNLHCRRFSVAGGWSISLPNLWAGASPSPPRSPLLLWAGESGTPLFFFFFWFCFLLIADKYNVLICVICLFVQFGYFFICVLRLFVQFGYFLICVLCLFKFNLVWSFPVVMFPPPEILCLLFVHLMFCRIGGLHCVWVFGSLVGKKNESFNKRGGKKWEFCSFKKEEKIIIYTLCLGVEKESIQAKIIIYTLGLIPVFFIFLVGTSLRGLVFVWILVCLRELEWVLELWLMGFFGKLLIVLLEFFIKF